MPEATVKPKRRHKIARVPSQPFSNGEADAASDTLTFVTSEGEHLVFTEMNLPLGEVAPVAGEEALGRIWNRPAADAAWRDI